MEDSSENARAVRGNEAMKMVFFFQSWVDEKLERVV